LALSLTALALSTTALISSYRRTDTIKKLLESVITGHKFEKSVRELAKKYSKRPKKRYIVFEVVPSGLKANEVEEVLYKTALELIGYKGVSELDMKLIHFDEKRSRGIVRVRWDKKYVMFAVLSLIRKVNGKDYMFIPLTTSGSLKRAKRAAGMS